MKPSPESFAEGFDVPLLEDLEAYISHLRQWTCYSSQVALKSSKRATIKSVTE